jgi:uncharacterized protein YfkK (UPF0435 family)
MIRSLSNPSHLNVKLNEEIEQRIIEKTRGIPFIVRLFFDQLRSKVDSTEYVVTETDVDGIVSNTQFYAQELIFNYYLNEKHDELVSNVLAFLYFVAKLGFISIGHLNYIRIEKENYLSPAVMDHLNSLIDDKKDLPLFIIDNLGIVAPYHDSVSEAIVSLVGNPQKLERDIKDAGEQAGIMDKKVIAKEIRRVEDLDLNYNIQEKAQNDFITKYGDFMMKSMDLYTKTCEREMNRTGSISDQTAYNFLSLFIEFLTRKRKFEFEVGYEEKFTDILKRIKINYDERGMEINIHMQLYFIFNALGWLWRPLRELKPYYLDLLSSRREEVAISIWGIIMKLLTDEEQRFNPSSKPNPIIKPEELQEQKKYLLTLLESPDEKIRVYAWALTVEKDTFNDDNNLLKVGVIKPEELVDRKKYSLSLLKSSDEEVLYGAWSIISSLIEVGVIKPEELLDRKEQLFDFLKYSAYFYPDVGRLDTAWSIISSLIEVGVIKPEELRDIKEHMLTSLKSPDEEIAYDNVWGQIHYLIESRVVTQEDKQFFLKLFYNTSERIRNNAWRFLYDFIKGGYSSKPNPIIKPEELQEQKNYLLSLLESPDEEILKGALESLYYAITYEVIKPEELVDRKEYFLSLLKRPDENTRLGAWDQMPSLLKVGVIKPEELQEQKNYLLSLLESPDEKIRWSAWSIVSDDSTIRRSLRETGVIKPEELVDRKDYLLSLLESQDQEIRGKAWSLLSSLFTYESIHIPGMVNLEDLQDRKEYLLSLLKSPDEKGSWDELREYLRWAAWFHIPSLINGGVIKPEELQEQKNYLLSLLESPDEKIRGNAWTIVSESIFPSLIDTGVIKPEELLDRKEYLLSLLTSPDGKIRQHAEKPWGMLQSFSKRYPKFR